jgi:5'-methylthioinosine phosphorylase
LLAVIGGSGFYSLEGFGGPADAGPGSPGPWGEPSGPVRSFRTGGSDVLFLARHGEDHSVPPHLVNYRANVHALAQAGATRVLSVATTGGMGSGCVPGALVVPDQLIDYTWGREHTFVAPGSGVRHIDFTEPYSKDFRAEVVAALTSRDPHFVDGGTYAAVQGPRFETAAEIDRLRRDGCTLVGMTGMPEAALAREAGLEYAAICPVGNLAAGLAGHELSLEEVVDATDPLHERISALVSDLASPAGESAR